ncbi:MAG: hypothetical protein ACXV8U_22350 [Methylobacter sp.]
MSNRLGTVQIDLTFSQRLFSLLTFGDIFSRDNQPTDCVILIEPWHHRPA